MMLIKIAWSDTLLDRIVASQSCELLAHSCSPDHESLQESLSQPSDTEYGVVLYSYLSLPLPHVIWSVAF